MVGTEKQIAWAEKIKIDRIKSVEEEIKEIAKYKTYVNPKHEKAEERLQYIDGIIAELKVVIENIKEEPRASRMIHNQLNDMAFVYNRPLWQKIKDMEDGK
jgi:hypothetical protein